MVVLRSRINTTDDVDTLGNQEGIITHLVLLAVGIMVGVIRTRLDKDREDTVTIEGRVRLTRRDDIVEGITETVEGVQDTGTHLAVHMCSRCIFRIILQRTRRLGVNEVGMHDVQTIHHILHIDVDGEVLVDRAGADLDEVVILCYQGIRIPRVATRHIRTRRSPFGTAHTGYIYGVEGLKDTHGIIPLVIRHTRAGERRGHLYRIIEDGVERILPVPTDTFRLGRREFDVSLSFQTTGLDGAERQRVVRLFAGTREDTGDVGVVVCLIMP